MGTTASTSEQSAPVIQPDTPSNSVEISMTSDGVVI